MSLIDTHCHLTFKVFKKNLTDVLTRAKQAGVEQMLTVGTNLGNSRSAVELAQNHKQIFASVGLHPHHVFEFYQTFTRIRPNADIDQHLVVAREQAQTLVDQLADLIATNPSRVVAIGEIGFDKHIYGFTQYEDLQITDDYLIWQKEFLLAQLKLAVKYDKAVLIHNREAVAELIETLVSFTSTHQLPRLVLHCCEPEDILLNLAQKHSWYIGVDGDLSYTPAKQEFIKKIPLEMLVIETDSPYLLPEPERTAKTGLPFKERCCEPAHVAVVAQWVARVKGLTVEQVAKQTSINAGRLMNV